MNWQSIEIAAKMAGRKVPAQWKDDTSQEVLTRCLELQSKGITLTPANVSAIAQHTIDYCYRHWVHDNPGKGKSKVTGQQSEVISLETIVSTIDGHNITLADALPSPRGIDNVEQWVMVRLALQSIPDDIAHIAARKLVNHRITDSQKRELAAWYQAYFQERPKSEVKRSKSKPLARPNHARTKSIMDILHGDHWDTIRAIRGTSIVARDMQA